MTALRYRALDAALAAGLLPDAVLRSGSRVAARERERRELRGGAMAREARRRRLIEQLHEGPVAESPELANRQHYELPAGFFETFLGPRRKYSGCLWPSDRTTLAEAEEEMLELTCTRAGVIDGMRILDLGCGWGSLSVWLAERYPAAEIVAVSNSSAQRRVIEAERSRRELDNLRVITADVNELVPPQPFDRVISIEMFEHMRNWGELLRRVRGWLRGDGRLFVHVFSHRRLSYRFEGTWAAERFFTAGLMPSHELISHFQDDLALEGSWTIPGTHYARTLAAWLERLDGNRDAALSALRVTGISSSAARAMLARWRLFLLCTQEMWRYGHGEHWQVSHYLLRPVAAAG